MSDAAMVVTAAANPDDDDAAVRAVRDRYDRGVLIAAIVVMAVWNLATNIPTSTAYWSTYSPAGTGAVVLVGYLAIGAVAAWAQLSGVGVNGVVAVVACALLVAGAAATALASPADVLDPAAWAYSNAGWLALVILWRRPATHLLAFYVVLDAALAVVHAVSGHADRVSWANVVMLSFGSAVMQFAVLVGARMVATLAAEGAVATRAQAQVETARLAAEAVHDARRRRYEAVQTASAELLAGLAADQLDLTDPGVRRALRLAVGRLRRLVVETDDVPAPLLHELRACADVAESRGVEVDLQALVGVLPPIDADDRRALTDPVMQVLAVAESHARVTVVSADRSDVAVAVVADAQVDLDHQVSSRAVEVSCDEEGGQQWVQARWTAPSRLPS